MISAGFALSSRVVSGALVVVSVSCSGVGAVEEALLSSSSSGVGSDVVGDSLSPRLGLMVMISRAVSGPLAMIVLMLNSPDAVATSAPSDDTT